MISVLIALTSFLIFFLTIANLYQKHQEKVIERKNTIITTQLSNISFIEGNIRDLQDIPISPKTITILLNRILHCVNTMRDCFPDNKEYLALQKNILGRIKQTNQIEVEKSLPKAVNDQHKLMMIKTLKKTIIILHQELNRQGATNINVGKQLAIADFFVAYLTAYHYIELADNACQNKTFGTARDRYESAIKTIETAPKSVGKSWCENRLNYCKQQLDMIHNEMKSANENYVRKKNPVVHDETGLNRMLDGTKNKIAVNY